MICLAAAREVYNNVDVYHDDLMACTVKPDDSFTILKFSQPIFPILCDLLDSTPKN